MIIRSSDNFIKRIIKYIFKVNSPTLKRNLYFKEAITGIIK